MVNLLMKIRTLNLVRNPMDSGASNGGTDIWTLKDMTLVMTIDKDTKRYKRNGDVLRMGDVNLSTFIMNFGRGVSIWWTLGLRGLRIGTS